MDLVIDYLGERHVVELKIWRGQAYHEKGEKQLAVCSFTGRFCMTPASRSAQLTDEAAVQGANL